VDLGFAALLLTFFLPLLVWYSILASLESRRSGSNRSQLFKIDLFNPRIAGEFCSERAIEAYEDLIDSTFAEGRQ
jgi:hypothetical protein